MDVSLADFLAVLSDVGAYGVTIAFIWLLIHGDILLGREGVAKDRRIDELVRERDIYQRLAFLSTDTARRSADTLKDVVDVGE